MRQFKRVLAFSKERKEITVETGITWRDLQEYIDPYELSVQIMQTYDNFTVGGALSVNAHGRYVTQGPIVLSVASIRLRAGERRECSASSDKNAELFYGAIGGYGALGVIVEATFVDGQRTSSDSRSYCRLLPIARISRKTFAATPMSSFTMQTYTRPRTTRFVSVLTTGR